MIFKSKLAYKFIELSDLIYESSNLFFDLMIFFILQIL